MLNGRSSGAATLLALMAISGALIAGCGGGDSEASSDVTRAEFTKEANAVCAERKKDWEAGVNTYNKELEQKKNLTLREQRLLLEGLFDDSLLPLLQAELKNLEDLEVPTADEEKIDKMLESRSQALEEVEDGGVKIMLEDEPFKAFEKEAKAYGFDCAIA